MARNDETEPEEFDDPNWVPDEILASMKMERSKGPTGEIESDEAISRRIFKENAPLAASAIARLAIHGASERTRLDASKYIVERVLGPVGNDVGAADPIRDFMEDVIQKAEAFANKGEVTD